MDFELPQLPSGHALSSRAPSPSSSLATMSLDATPNEPPNPLHFCPGDFSLPQHPSGLNQLVATGSNSSLPNFQASDFSLLPLPQLPLANELRSFHAADFILPALPNNLVDVSSRHPLPVQSLPRRKSCHAVSPASLQSFTSRDFSIPPYPVMSGDPDSTQHSNQNQLASPSLKDDQFLPADRTHPVDRTQLVGRNTLVGQVQLVGRAQPVDQAQPVNQNISFGSAQPVNYPPARHPIIDALSNAINRLPR